MKRRAFVLLLLAMIAAASEFVAWVGIEFLAPNLRMTRTILMLPDDTQPVFMNTVSQAYLLYAPNPDFASQGHNPLGFRGKAVTLAKTPGTARVLVLGGSTVYGWNAGADETYPAALEQLINKEGGPRVEVMNAGLPAGTSAESFTHYHFKFAYFHPDIVVIEAGGNDANASAAPYYHPDYSHRRQVLTPLTRLSSIGKALLHSYAVSLILIPIVEGLHPADITVDRPAAPPTIRWYPEIPAGNDQPQLEATSVGFERNVKSLIAEAKADGATVLLLPFIDDPAFHDRPEVATRVVYDDALLEKIGKETNTDFLPMSGKQISPQNWLDNCHLNGPGNMEKARIILPELKKLIAAIHQ